MASTAALWARQDRHEGDRRRLFRAVSEAVDVRSVLYPGSYVDVAPSFVWSDVTYVDVDRRANRFFDDATGVSEIIAGQPDAPDEPHVAFLHVDYKSDLPVPDETFDLLVSLYAGPVSKYCTRYLRHGGWLLANPSHGDTALASIDDRYELVGVVLSESGAYAVGTTALDEYLIPKRPVELIAEAIEESGRGIAYTKPAFAYLFRRIR